MKSQNRKQTILILILLNLLTCSLSAQVNNRKDTKQASWHNISYNQFITNDTLHRWQIGINTQFFTDGLYDDANDIFDSQLTPIEFMVRRQTTLNQAMRLRIFGIKDKFTREEGSTTIETYKSMLGLALGYEWQMLLGKRWKLYYGFEAEWKRIWDNSKEERDVYYPSSNATGRFRSIIKRKTNRIAILPLLGLNFYITPRLTLSTELKIDVNYEKFSYKEDNFRTSPPDKIIFVPSGGGEFSITNTSIYFQPYTGIYINFKF